MKNDDRIWTEVIWTGILMIAVVLAWCFSIAADQCAIDLDKTTLRDPSRALSERFEDLGDK